MLYVESRKSLEGRRGKKIIILPSANKKHSATTSVCRVPKKTLGKNISLPSVNKKHSANLSFA